MKDRIAHIMRAKNLKASDFAELLGIQPSGISHILSGRNQPSLDFVKKIKETFPEYNLDWIIFGKGPMTTSEPFKENLAPSSNPSEAYPATPVEQNNPPIPFSPITDTSTPAIPSVDTTPIPEKRGIKSLFVLYDDGTFENFSPR